MTDCAINAFQNFIFISFNIVLLLLDGGGINISVDGLSVFIFNQLNIYANIVWWWDNKTSVHRTFFLTFFGGGK